MKEVELKFKLSEQEHTTLVNILRPYHYDDDHMWNNYYDTENWGFHKNNCTLRIRKLFQEGKITAARVDLKVHRPSSSAKHTAYETEYLLPLKEPMSIKDFDTKYWRLHEKSETGPVWAHAKKYAAGCTARSIGGMYVERKRYTYHGLDLELDKAIYLDGTCDYELEIETSDTDRALEVVRCLFALCEIEVVPTQHGKRSRFLSVAKKLHKAGGMFFPSDVVELSVSGSRIAIVRVEAILLTGNLQDPLNYLVRYGEESFVVSASRLSKYRGGMCG